MIPSIKTNPCCFGNDEEVVTRRSTSTPGQLSLRQKKIDTVLSRIAKDNSFNYPSESAGVRRLLPPTVASSALIGQENARKSSWTEGEEAGGKRKASWETVEGAQRRKWAISFVTSIQRDGFSSLGWKSNRMGAHRPELAPFLHSLLPERNSFSPGRKRRLHVYDSIYVTGARPGWGYDKFPVYKLIWGSINPSPVRRREPALRQGVGWTVLPATATWKLASRSFDSPIQLRIHFISRYVLRRFPSYPRSWILEHLLIFHV